MSENAEATPPEEQPSEPLPARRSLWRQVALALVILLCGMIIGAAGAILVTAHVISDGGRDPGQVPDAIVDRMTGHLRLTPDQAQKVGGIIRRRLTRVQEIRLESRQQAHEELEAMRDEVAEVLDEEQARRWRAQFGRARRLGPPHPQRPRRGGSRPRGGRPIPPHGPP